MTGRLFLYANLAVAFGLELAALAAFGNWGATTGAGPFTNVALGIGTPLSAALLWGVFASPHAPVSVPAVAAAVRVAFFLAAAMALQAAGHRRLAAAFVVVVVVNNVLLQLPHVSVGSRARSATLPGDDQQARNPHPTPARQSATPAVTS